MMTVQIWNCLLLRRKEHGSSLHSDAILKEIGKKVLRELDTDRIDPHKDVIKENWIHIFFFFVANNSYLNHHYLEADSSAGGASVHAGSRKVSPRIPAHLPNFLLLAGESVTDIDWYDTFDESLYLWLGHMSSSATFSYSHWAPWSRTRARWSYASQGPPRAWTPSCPGAWYLVGGKWRNWHKHRPVLKSFARKTVHL